MKREFLNSFDGQIVNEEIINKIFAEYGKSIKEKEEAITSLKTERDSYKSSLDEANKTIKDFEKVDIESKDQAIKDWENKYNNDINELNNKISKQSYEFKVKSLANELKFSSNGARNDFINKALEKNLAIENDKVLGWDDFVNNYKEQDSRAFEESKEPQAIASTGSNHEENNASDLDLRKAMGL